MSDTTLILLVAVVWLIAAAVVALGFGKWKRMDEPERPENLAHEGFRECDADVIGVDEGSTEYAGIAEDIQ